MASSKNIPPYVALAIMFLFSGCKEKEPPKETATAAAAFTEWFPRHLFNEFLLEREKTGADGQNYWTKGHCVEKIESRWADGYQQYRIVLGRTPKDKAFQWMWYFDMDKEFFQKKLTKLSMEGYQMVSLAHNVTPSGSDSFAAVWHRASSTKKE